MNLTDLSNEELADLYVNYKQKQKIFKKRTSFYNLNKYMEMKEYLSCIKWEIKKRGLKKKAAKKLSNY